MLSFNSAYLLQFAVLDFDKPTENLRWSQKTTINVCVISFRDEFSGGTTDYKSNVRRGYRTLPIMPGMKHDSAKPCR